MDHHASVDLYSEIQVQTQIMFRTSHSLIFGSIIWYISTLKIPGRGDVWFATPC
jgi:hypothetical protein